MTHIIRSTLGALAASVVLSGAAAFGSPLSAQTEVGPGSVVTGTSGVESRNESIEIGDGAVIEGPVRTRNGRLDLGEDVEVGAEVENRNGRITLGPGTTVRGPVVNRNGRVELGDGVRIHGTAETRNGRIHLGTDGEVQGDLDTRNGAIEVASGARVAGNVSTRNGQVDLDGATVGGYVDVHRGDVNMVGRTEVQGDVILLMPEGAGGWLPSWLPFVSDPEPVVRIEEDVRIHGRLIVDERARLDVASGAQVPEPERYPHRDAWTP